MEAKKIITGDYEDTTTGIRFLEDIDGRIHCMSCMFNPSNAPPVGDTVTNNYNTTNNYQTSDIYAGVPQTIVQTALMDFTWPNTTDFHRINNNYSGGYTGYTTPIDKEFHITELVASQGFATLSLLGLHKAGNLLLSLPLYQDLRLKFFRPIVIPHSTYVELKFKPGTKKISLAVCMIGYLI